MNETITIEIPGEEIQKEMQSAMQPYRKQISETPALLSLLYDIDLLPEQIRLPVNVGRMIAVCAMFKVLTPDQIHQLVDGSVQQSVTQGEPK